MKNASLLLSTALASLIVLAPATLTSADAATIKIKPQVVKVKPKIAVAKPKLRLKVKAARVRVTPKLRVKVKPKIAIAKPKLRVKVKPRIKAANIKPRVKVKAKAPKIVTTLKATPKIAAPALNIKPRIKVQAVAKAIGKVKPAAIIKPQVKVASTPPKATIRQTGAAAVVDRVVIPSGISDAAQGARAAAAARDAIKLGAIGAEATGKLVGGLGDFNVPVKTVPSNTEVVGDFIKEPKGGSGGAPGSDGKWDGGGIGRINADNFVGLPNTHSPAGTDPNTAAGGAMAYWNGKRDGAVAGAIAGVAGEKSSYGPHGHREAAGDGPSGSGRTESGHYVDERRGGEKLYVTYWRDADGRYHHVERYVDGDRDRTTRTVYTPEWSTRRTGTTYETSRNADAGRTVESGPTGGTEEDVYRRQTPAPSELRNPDHASGGSTPFWWVNEREKATFDFSKAGSGGKSPGAMPDTPHTETGTPTSQRVLSQNDVLERYHEDSRNRAGGKALSQQDLCAHSEC
jgi:hypothetical protein